MRILRLYQLNLNHPGKHIAVLFDCIIAYEV